MSLYPYVDRRALHSFPTRRSSDLKPMSVRKPVRRAAFSFESWVSQNAWRASIVGTCAATRAVADRRGALPRARSEEHTSELQSRGHLVCRLLLEKKKQINLKVMNR